MTYYCRGENPQVVWPIEGLMEAIPPVFELRRGRLCEVDLLALSAPGVTLHVPAASDGGQVSVQDAMKKVFSEVRVRSGRVISYAHRDISSAASSVLLAADEIHVHGASEVFFHAAAKTRRKGEFFEPILPIPLQWAIQHRDEVFSILRRIPDPDLAAAFHKAFSEIIADKNNPRDEFSLRGDVLAFLGLACAHPTPDDIRFALCANSGWKIDFSDPVLANFFENPAY